MLHLVRQRVSQAKHAKELETQLEKKIEDVRVRLKDSLVIKKEGKKIRLVLKEAGKNALISSLVLLVILIIVIIIFLCL